MRQAIEEGFIHDVLASYTTYQTFFHLEKSITDDPAYETVKARRAIARFLTLHEHNLAQKAEIVDRALPPAHRRQGGRPGQGDGGLLVPGARPAVRRRVADLRRRPWLRHSACSSPSPERWTATSASR